LPHILVVAGETTFDAVIEPSSARQFIGSSLAWQPALKSPLLA
jgi:hypothetical protein